MRFDIITIFPKIFDSYFGESILNRAQKKNLIKIGIHDLRQWTNDRHKTVDGKPYGGGAGMIFKIEPIYKAVKEISNCHPGLDPGSIPHLRDRFRGNDKGGVLAKKKRLKRRVILFSAKGKQFTQADVRRLATCDQLILICGRYEGVDERVAAHIADEELSVGNFVLTGGEIPAMIVVDTVSRLIPGVLGKAESLKEESFSLANRKSQIADRKFKNTISDSRLAISYLEYPQYTRPEKFRGWKVPEILLSGDHAKIRKWRVEKSKTAK